MRRTVFSLMIMGALVSTIALTTPVNSHSRRRARGPDNAPKVGDVAPTFKLKSLDGKSETDLASFRDERPVILFFGSYT